MISKLRQYRRLVAALTVSSFGLSIIGPELSFAIDRFTAALPTWGAFALDGAAGAPSWVWIGVGIILSA